MDPISETQTAPTAKDTLDVFSLREAEEKDEVLFSDAQEYQIKRKELASSGLSYFILRWPLIAVIGSCLTFEFIMYCFVRLWVWVYERVASVSKGHTIRKDKKLLASANDLKEWRTAAIKLDSDLQTEDWKKLTESPYYDYHLIKDLKRQVCDYQKEKNLTKLMTALRIACRSNIGGIENEQLYSHTYYGTKYLIKDFIKHVLNGLDFVYNSDIPLEQKSQFFKDCSKSYGKTALCLSGGATLTFYHLGVLKCLLEQSLLPQVVSGTSGGALVASLICCRTDPELKALLRNPKTLVERINAADEGVVVPLKRLVKKGVVFDQQRWIEKMKWVANGDTTFLEAFQRTGKILNITVIPTEKHSPPTLLNYRTAPHVVIYSAVLASASIPLLVEPIELLHKTEEGTLEPFYAIGKSWRDGSFKTDIPAKPLHRLFNVNYTLVSQVNPHIAFFFFESRGSGGAPSLHRKGKGWRGGFIASSIEHFLKLDMLKWLRFLRALDLLPHVLGADGSFLFLQRFNGNCTIIPRPRFKDYVNLISFVDEEAMQRFIRVGEKITWPKLSMISNRMRVEEKLQDYKMKLHNEYCMRVKQAN